jgi:hypothetical protein
MFYSRSHYRNLSMSTQNIKSFLFDLFQFDLGDSNHIGNVLNWYFYPK